MKPIFIPIIIVLLLIHQPCTSLFGKTFFEVSVRNLHLHENFTELQVRDLIGVLYYKTLSQLGVSKLKILNNRLTELEPGAICSPPHLRSIEINFAANPEAPALTKHVFRQCHHQITELFLRFDYDHPSRLDKNALEDFNLESLGLQCYRIGILKKNFLTLKQETLKKLVLSNCYIRSINTNVFEDMTSLVHLEITHNPGLIHLPEDLFLNNKRLKSLDLRYNRIRELQWNEFDGLRSLEELNLSGNRLAYFDAGKIATAFPNLRKIEILKNIWPCKLKEEFVEELEEKINRSVEVIFAINGCRKFEE